jgi:hypothetical protein
MLVGDPRGVSREDRPDRLARGDDRLALGNVGKRLRLFDPPAAALTETGVVDLGSRIAGGAGPRRFYSCVRANARSPSVTVTWRKA